MTKEAEPFDLLRSKVRQEQDGFETAQKKCSKLVNNAFQKTIS
jgi:hypothetical protein